MDDAKNLMLSMMNTLKERIGNPLIGAFATAWVVWNFKIVLVIFSKGDGGWKAKNDYIFKDLMQDWSDWLLHGYVVPLGIACIWIFALPPILRKISCWHEKQNNLTREKLFEATQEKVLSKADEQALREHILAERLKIIENRERDAKALQGLIEDNSKISNSNIELQKEITRLIEINKESIKKEQDLSSRLKNLAREVDPPAVLINSEIFNDKVKFDAALELIGFKEPYSNKLYTSFIKNEKNNFIIPMIFLRDAAFQNVVIFDRNQILDENIMISIMVLSKQMQHTKSHSMSYLKDQLNRVGVKNAESLVERLLMHKYLRGISAGDGNIFYVMDHRMTAANDFLLRIGFELKIS
ncbi:hypothetical protein [Comamonas sp. 17RB]|uniref:hypothetical protein n=1 Tax=Comamonas sp. 17RB TaxID=3047025 RepID=UPI0024B719A2|nr:hypothetical protein [Comamonas sp. 17RB]MDI9853610.1 hypothetical protein [Comamonas sp. 17RB]